MVPATPTISCAEEAAFLDILLKRPEDDTARKVFADWLDERGRRVEAKYLREIRRHKFVQLVRQRGLWAFYPEWARTMPPPVEDPYSLTSQPPLIDFHGNEPIRPRSARCRAWVGKIKRGWRPPKWIAHHGHAMRTRYYGVYVWELLNVIDPLTCPWSRTAGQDQGEV